MFLLAFIEKIHREGGPSPDVLREEFLAAGRKVAHDVFGPQPLIETTWNGENGTIEFRQVLVAVDRVERPYRELAVAKLRALGGDFSGIGAGEELELSVFFTPDDEAHAQELDAQFGGLLALSCSQSRLWGPLDEALIEVVHRHLPPKTWPEGTVAHLFQGESWLTGLRGEKDGIAVAIAGGIWKEKPVSPDMATIQYGLRLLVERGGHSLEVPVEASADSAKILPWVKRPASPTRSAAVEKELARVAASLAGDTVIDKLDGPGIVSTFLRILVEPPG